jgi:hypothetical protein
MQVFCKYEGSIYLPLAQKDPQRKIDPGVNEVPDEYFEKLTAGQQRTIVRLWERGLIAFEVPEAVELPSPAAESTSESVPLDVLLPQIEGLYDVALLDHLSRQDARSEVQQAILKRCLELDSMTQREVEAHQNQSPELPTQPETPESKAPESQPAKRKGGRPKGSKNRPKGDSEPPPTLPASE